MVGAVRQWKGCGAGEIDRPSDHRAGMEEGKRRQCRVRIERDIGKGSVKADNNTRSNKNEGLCWCCLLVAMHKKK